MKVIKRYCEACNKYRKHTKQKYFDGFVRCYFAVFTFGFSELANSAHYKCLRCGTKTIEEMV